MNGKDDFTWATDAIRTLLVRALLALAKQMQDAAAQEGAKR